MSGNHSLKAHARKLQALIESGEFTESQGQPMPCEVGIRDALDLLKDVRGRRGSVYLVGNGGSAAVVSHILNDFIHQAGLRAMTLHEASLATCMANDYGYENVYSRPLSSLAQAGDLLIAVSSSGKSINILNAAQAMKDLSGKVITLTGFDRENPLRQMGAMNFWLDSDDYGLVEVGHLFFLHYLSDSLKK